MEREPPSMKHYDTLRGSSRYGWNSFAGLMHIAERAAGDTCLYSERYVYQVVNDTGSLSGTSKMAANAAFSYYFGADENSTVEDIASQVSSQQMFVANSRSGILFTLVHDYIRVLRGVSYGSVLGAAEFRVIWYLTRAGPCRVLMFP